MNSGCPKCGGINSYNCSVCNGRKVSFLMQHRKLSMAILTAASLIGVAGCSVADPNPSEVALKYNGGPFSNQQFLGCVTPGTRDINGPNDNYFYYPHGTRTYNFLGAPGQPANGAEEGAISVNTKNNVQMLVTGSITFTLNESCAPFKDSNGHYWPGGMLQKFHDTIGRSHAMFAGDSNADFGGNTTWTQGLNLFLGKPASKALNNAGLAYTWQQLYSDLTARNAFVAQAEADIKTLIRQQAGDDFFLIQNVQVDQPQPPDSTIDEMNKLQNQQIQNQQAAQAQQLAASFPGGINGYLEYQQKKAVNDAISSGKVQILPVPMGSSIIVGGK